MRIFVNLGAFVSSWQKKITVATKTQSNSKEEEMDLISRISQLN